MEVKMQLSKALNINQTLKIIIEDTQAKVDSLLKFKFLGIMKAIEPFASNFDMIRNEKIMEYGEKTTDGNYQILKEKKDAVEHFNYDLTQVLNSEVIINISKLKAADIFNKGITTERLLELYPIIEE